MRGLHEFIPTQKKIDYINQLLKVGFDTIDFESFVSSKAIMDCETQHNGHPLRKLKHKKTLTDVHQGFNILVAC